MNNYQAELYESGVVRVVGPDFLGAVEPPCYIPEILRASIEAYIWQATGDRQFNLTIARHVEITEEEYRASFHRRHIPGR